MKIEKIDRIPGVIPSIRDYNQLVTYSSQESIVFGMTWTNQVITPDTVQSGTLGVQILDYAVHGSRGSFNNRIAHMAAKTLLEERLRFNLSGKEGRDNLLAHLLVRFFNEESKNDCYVDQFEDLSHTYTGGILNHYKLMIQNIEKF